MAVPRPGLVAVGVLAVGATLARIRTSDCVRAALLGTLFLPVLLLIALCVGLTSRGPVLVRADGTVPGASGLRFRTITIDDASSPTGAPRLTAVGRVLRALGLDELPCLLDVARGRSPMLRH